MSKFKDNIIIPIYENEVLRLPYVKDGCNVVEVCKTQSGNLKLDFYKLTETEIYYYAFNQWNVLPDLSYNSKRTNFYFCVQI